MATSNKTVEVSALTLAREAVTTAQTKLNTLRSDFELMRRDQESVLNTLDRELQNCRNGDEREAVHNRIKFTKDETIALINTWRKDIDFADSELNQCKHEVRQIINDLNEAEYNKFKSTIDLNALFKAFAFHRETFHSTTWDKFLLDTFRQPERDELNVYDVMEL